MWEVDGTFFGDEFENSNVRVEIREGGVGDFERHGKLDVELSCEQSTSVSYGLLMSLRCPGMDVLSSSRADGGMMTIEPPLQVSSFVSVQQEDWTHSFLRT